MRNVITRWVGGILGLLLLVPFVTPVSAAPGQQPERLSRRDRQLLAEARARGETTVTVLIAAEEGANSTVINEVRSIGGKVEVTNTDIGYVQVSVPIARAEAIASLDGIAAFGLDEILPLENPRPLATVDPTPQPPPGPSTPRTNPYMPTGDTGAAQFVADHRTWDGRGVTIGILDTGVDLSHPALKTTTTGERKIIDWVTFTDPANDNDPTWLRMNTAVSGSTFTFQGVTYTAPAAGNYRIAVFNERVATLGGELGNDVNRDGNPAGSSGLFAVLWDITANNVWVDTDQDNSFADQTAMTDYRVRYDIGTFGTDNPATAIHESMPFVVETRRSNPANPANDFVNIGIVSGAHGSHVAGITAANRLFGGAANGAAPGAKLVTVRVCLFITGCTSSALINGMIYAAQTANVDVINMSIGGLPALNAGENDGPANTRAILYNRLIDENDVQIFISAGNSGPGLNTIGDPAVASKVLSSGSYITNATWASNYGSSSSYRDNLHNYSSRGPREDGGFKPEVVAPGSAISTVPMWQPGQPVVGVYELPPGYAMFNGTSMASPQSAGAAALLVSAAKQSNVQHKPAQLRQALLSTARMIDPSRFKAYDQGNGLIDVDDAWKMLRKNLKPVTITSSVPVNTLLSEFLTTPGFGTGIYDREGVVPNSTYVRQYTFTRTTGSTRSILYHVRWSGDKSAFEAPNTIKLPLNQPVTMNVRVKVRGPGTYSALMRLEDSSTKGIDFQTLNTVIVANRFTSANNYSVTQTGRVGRNQMLHFFYNIPAGTPAFKVDLTGTTGQVRFLRFDAYGLPAEPTGTNSLQCYLPAVPGNGCNGTTRTVVRPQAGVWEVSLDTRRTSDVANSNFQLTATILGATVAPNPDTIATATIGVPVARSYTLTNVFGPFTGRATGSTLSSARRGTFTIADLAQQQYQIVVTPGSTSLRVTIGGTSDAAADLDLFVFNCTTGTCVLTGQSADGDSEESVTIANPAAGTWIALVDGFAVPAGTTTYNYIDTFTNPAFGSVAVTDANALRAAGSSWTVPASVTANSAPAAGRVLLGNVQVLTDANIMIGSGDVVITNVTP